MGEKRVDLLRIETCYKGFLGLNRYHLRHQLFSGEMSPPLVRERIESFQAAAVLLYDPKRDAVVLIEQFRIGAMEGESGAWVLEVVGGIIEAGEMAETVAVREAMEEADCQVTELQPITRFMVSPGFSNERIHLFCGRVDAANAGGVHGLSEEGEDIRVVVMPADQALSELYGGRANSTSIIVALQWLAANREKLQRQWK